MAETIVENERPEAQAREGGDLPSSAGLPVWKRYAVSLICVLVAFGIRYWLTPILGEELPFMLFIAAALVAAYYGGAVTGIVALMLGLLLADYFFIPRAKMAMSRTDELLHLVQYLFTASIGIALIEVLQRGRRQTQAALEGLRKEVTRRRASEAALTKAQAELARHAEELEFRVEARTSELQAALHSLKELLYHIAHNLRGPLRAMNGYASLLAAEHGLQLGPKGIEYSRHISRAAERMDTLIQDLLEYGRLGHTELRCVPVSLSEAVASAVVHLAHEIRVTRAAIERPGTLPWVQADPKVLEQVLINLLENAIKFGVPGLAPEVRIRAEPRGTRIRLWIHDNGLGIDPQYQKRIFEPFEALYPNRGTEGTGIGLAIVKQGIQRMGGDVGVESELGGGSRFWIELPSAPQPG